MEGPKNAWLVLIELKYIASKNKKIYTTKFITKENKRSHNQ